MWWLKDPNQKDTPSVSLTLLLVCFLMIVAAGAFELAGKIKSTGPFLDLFWGAAALYFGRRLSFSNKGVSGDNSDKQNQ